MIENDNKTCGPGETGASFVDTYVGVTESMIKITQKIQAAYEVRAVDPNRWPPESHSSAAQMAQEVTRQWHNRQRASASLRLSRQQLRRA